MGAHLTDEVVRSSRSSSARRTGPSQRGTTRAPRTSPCSSRTRTAASGCRRRWAAAGSHGPSAARGRARGDRARLCGARAGPRCGEGERLRDRAPARRDGGADRPRARRHGARAARQQRRAVSLIHLGNRRGALLLNEVNAAAYGGTLQPYDPSSSTQRDRHLPRSGGVRRGAAVDRARGALLRQHAISAFPGCRINQAEVMLRKSRTLRRTASEASRLLATWAPHRRRRLRGGRGAAAPGRPREGRGGVRPGRRPRPRPRARPLVLLLAREARRRARLDPARPGRRPPPLARAAAPCLRRDRPRPTQSTTRPRRPASSRRPPSATTRRRCTRPPRSLPDRSRSPAATRSSSSPAPAGAAALAGHERTLRGRANACCSRAPTPPAATRWARDHELAQAGSVFDQLGAHRRGQGRRAPGPRRRRVTMTFVFTDIVDSTRHLEHHGQLAEAAPPQALDPPYPTSVEAAPSSTTRATASSSPSRRPTAPSPRRRDPAGGGRRPAVRDPDRRPHRGGDEPRRELPRQGRPRGRTVGALGRGEEIVASHETVAALNGVRSSEPRSEQPEGSRSRSTSSRSTGAATAEVGARRTLRRAEARRRRSRLRSSRAWASGLRDRFLRDHALGDVLARGQLEHHVEARSR